MYWKRRTLFRRMTYSILQWKHVYIYSFCFIPCITPAEYSIRAVDNDGFQRIGGQDAFLIRRFARIWASDVSKTFSNPLVHRIHALVISIITSIVQRYKIIIITMINKCPHFSVGPGRMLPNFLANRTLCSYVPVRCIASLVGRSRKSMVWTSDVRLDIRSAKQKKKKFKNCDTIIRVLGSFFLLSKIANHTCTNVKK